MAEQRKNRKLGRGLSSLLGPHSGPPSETVGGDRREPATNAAGAETDPNKTNVRKKIGIDLVSQGGHSDGWGDRAGMMGHEDHRVADKASSGGGTGLFEVRLEAIVVNPHQPRRFFDEDALDELAASIGRSGVMQPIVVRHKTDASGKDRYELVAGERRWRAAHRAGLQTIPAVVRQLSDEEASEWALVENMQREDLNPMERAYGLRALAENFGLSHADVADRVGLNRSTVTNLIRLTELEHEVQALVAQGQLSMGHARVLVGVGSAATQIRAAKAAVAQRWTVRQMERYFNSPPTHSSKASVPLSEAEQRRVAVIADLEHRMETYFGTKVMIKMRGKSNRGRIVLDFYDLTHFEDVLRRMGVPDEKV